MEKTSFILQFNLKTPIILNDWLTLDALLAGIIYQQTKDYDKAHNEIPLVKTEGVYHGSAGFLIAENPKFHFFDTGWINGNRMVQGHFDDERIDLKGQNIFFPDRGEHQSSADPLFYFNQIHAIRFYGQGDIKEIKKIVGIGQNPHGVFGLGKKRNQGYGLVRAALYEPIQKDLSLIFNNVPMRPLPVNHSAANGLKNVPIDYAGTRPPYYKSENKEMCFVPVSNIWNRNKPSEFCKNKIEFDFNTSNSIRKSMEEFANLLFEVQPVENNKKSKKNIFVCECCGIDTNKHGLDYFSTSDTPCYCPICYAFSRTGKTTSFLFTPDKKIIFYKGNGFQIDQTCPEELIFEKKSYPLIDIILNPPKVPWFYIEGARSVKKIIGHDFSNIKFNYSNDIIYISGPRPRSLKVYEIKKAIHYFNTSSLIDTDLFNFVDGIQGNKNKLDRLRKKYSDIDMLIDKFPIAYSYELECLKQLGSKIKNEAQEAKKAKGEKENV